MQETSFERELATLRELGSNTFVLRGSTLIVEVLPPEEIKTAGGIVLATTADHAKGQSVAAHKIDIGKVLMCGQGYWSEGNTEHLGYDEEGNSSEILSGGGFEPLEVQPGAIVFLPQYSTQFMSHFPGISKPTGNKLAMVKMDQILAYYPSVEAYELAKEKMR